MIFLTGATGLLGPHILRNLLIESDSEIALLIRAKSKKHSIERLKELLARVFREKYIPRKYLSRIKLFIGDQSEKDLGLATDEFNVLKNNVTEVFHAAALAEFRKPLELVRLINVKGTKNMLEFSLECRNIKKFNYIGTAFVSGNAKGNFSENDFDVGQEFNNTYEQSKYEAERLVRKYQKDYKLLIPIYRPSIVVGEYDTGITNNFRMFYQPFRTFSKKLINRIPIDFNTHLNLISCDWAAKAIYLINKNYHESCVYHIVSPTEEEKPILKLMKFVSVFFSYTEPQYVYEKDFKLRSLTPVLRRIIEPYIPYFTFKARFSSKFTEGRLKSLGFKYPPIDESYLSRLFEYCRKCNYIKPGVN